MIVAPTATGNKTKFKPCSVRITIIGFAPAGGCVVLVIIIINTAKPTAMPMEKNVSPNK